MSTMNAWDDIYSPRPELFGMEYNVLQRHFHIFVKSERRKDIDCIGNWDNSETKTMLDRDFNNKSPASEEEMSVREILEKL